MVKVAHDCLMAALAICKPGTRYRDVGDVITRHATANGWVVNPGQGMVACSNVDDQGTSETHALQGSLLCVMACSGVPCTRQADANGGVAELT